MLTCLVIAAVNDKGIIIYLVYPQTNTVLGGLIMTP